MLKQTCCGLATAALLAGCGVAPPFETATAITPPSVVTTLDPVSQSLLAAAERTSDALDRLSLVEQTRTPVPDPGRVSQAPPGLDRKANIDWNGPLAPLVARIAAEGGYEFRTVGDVPVVPVVVDITRDDETLVEILRNIGYQATGRALVSVDVAQRRIEVRYGPN
ncbi:MAG: DotD/TraH family lipoprotein [Pseudomonadota bacterium]